MIVFILAVAAASLVFTGGLLLIHHKMRWDYIGVLQILASGAYFWSVFYIAGLFQGALQ